MRWCRLVRPSMTIPPRFLCVYRLKCIYQRCQALRLEERRPNGIYRSYELSYGVRRIVRSNHIGEPAPNEFWSRLFLLLVARPCGNNNDLPLSSTTMVEKCWCFVILLTGSWLKIVYE